MAAQAGKPAERFRKMQLQHVELQVVAGSFGPVSTDPVLNYFIAPNNTVLMIEPTGIVAQVVNGQTSDLSTSSIANVISGGFSYDGKKAFIAFGDPQNPQTDVFDLATKT